MPDKKKPEDKNGDRFIEEPQDLHLVKEGEGKSLAELLKEQGVEVKIEESKQP
jgi:hypothetical protein